MRLLLVSAYNVGCWHEQRTRMTYRATKPVERETFEYVDPAKNFKLLIEEVPLHTPPPPLPLPLHFLRKQSCDLTSYGGALHIALQQLPH